MAIKAKEDKSVANEVRSRILRKAEELFFMHGFSRVTIDEIVRELGMSKKTIYRYFSNKKEIIQAVVSLNQDELIGKIDGVLGDETVDYVQRLKTVFGVLSIFFSKISGTIIEDLKRHLPDIWKSVAEFKQKMSLERISKILNEGIQRGLFRKDIDKRLILLTYRTLLEGVILQNRQGEIPFPENEIFEAIIKILYSGILTESARKTFFKG
jgi:AcrR family transcriptional regulator